MCSAQTRREPYYSEAVLSSIMRSNRTPTLPGAETEPRPEPRRNRKNTQTRHEPYEQLFRLIDNSKIIWGAANEVYDLKCECYGFEEYRCTVRTFEASGSHLAITGICHSPQQAWNELDRMLAEWAHQLRIGQPMTAERVLDIVAGGRAHERAYIEQVIDLVERKEPDVRKPLPPEPQKQPPKVQRYSWVFGMDG